MGKIKFLNLIKLSIFLFLIIFTYSQFINAATVEIPYFITIFSINSSFQTTPLIYFDLALRGGLKTNINLFFSFFYSENSIFDVNDVNGNPHQIVPTFYLKSLNATISNLFGFLDFSLFINDFRNAGYGGDFNNFYYSMDISKTFESVYKISGYGISLKANLLNKLLSIAIYGYQPLISLAGTSKLDCLDISVDLNFEDLSISIFTGTENFSIYRAAFSAFFNKKIFSLLLTIGIEDISTYTDFFSLYFLFEQKFVIQNFYESFSFFSKPESYLGQSLTADNENTDIIVRVDLGYKDKYNSLFIGVFTSIDLRNYNLYSLISSPYIKILSSGILWRIEVGLNLLNINSILLNIKFSFESAF